MDAMYGRLHKRKIVAFRKLQISSQICKRVRRHDLLWCYAPGRHFNTLFIVARLSDYNIIVVHCAL